MHRASPVLLWDSLLILVNETSLSVHSTNHLIALCVYQTVKVRFQNPGVDRKYHSTMHAITTIIREERFIGLYKGIMSPLVDDLMSSKQRR